MKVNSRADSEPITRPLNAATIYQRACGEGRCREIRTRLLAVFERIVIEPGTLCCFTESGREAGDCALTYFPDGGVNALSGLQAVPVPG
ncbi:hypothetical protein [Kluyvera intermedia]|uniref:hypothetical protein n=1 Tax=Kluyvera intermedia TaxID=61648 RepID=UPI00111C0731|nr:hypothetical protein [Kluyvera intermedia]